MKIARLGPLGQEIPVVYDSENIKDARAVTKDFDSEFFASNGLERLSRELESLPTLAEAGSMRFGAPIARPSAVYCIGMNYAAHAREGGANPPTNLVMFMKPPNTVVGPNDDVPLPPGSLKSDWEVELGLVVGKRASYLKERVGARGYLAGYLTANDLSERAAQLEVSGGQWSKGKGAPGFCPLGPWLVTTDSFNPDDAQLRSFVNGEPRQDSRTADMIFGIDEIVHTLSQFVALEPGDVILTGTPEGVGASGRFSYLKVGDRVEIEVVGLGRQSQRVVPTALGE